MHATFRGLAMQCAGGQHPCLHHYHSHALLEARPAHMSQHSTGPEARRSDTAQCCHVRDSAHQQHHPDCMWLQDQHDAAQLVAFTAVACPRVPGAGNGAQNGNRATIKPLKLLYKPQENASITTPPTGRISQRDTAAPTLHPPPHPRCTSMPHIHVGTHRHTHTPRPAAHPSATLLPVVCCSTCTIGCHWCARPANTRQTTTRQVTRTGRSPRRRDVDTHVSVSVHLLGRTPASTKPILNTHRSNGLPCECNGQQTQQTYRTSTEYTSLGQAFTAGNNGSHPHTRWCVHCCHRNKLKHKPTPPPTSTNGTGAQAQSPLCWPAAT